MLMLRMEECQKYLKADILEHHTKLLLTGATLYLGSALVAMSARNDEGIIWMARILMFNATLVLITACSTHLSKDN